MWYAAAKAVSWQCKYHPTSAKSLRWFLRHAEDRNPTTNQPGVLLKGGGGRLARQRECHGGADHFEVRGG
jgi:hypothetical protein